MMMFMMNLITYMALDCENFTSRELYENYANDVKRVCFNCRLKELSVWNEMFSGRLFKAVRPDTETRSPNLVQDDRLGTASLTADVTQIVAWIALR